MNFDNFFSHPEFSAWHTVFHDAIERRTDPKRHGDLPDWLAILHELPDARPSEIHLDRDTVTFGKADDLTAEQAAKIRAGLLALKPWRKGPYQVFDTFIDTEWRSDWKWQRVAPHISDLNNRTVLDVGCGTGYHCWRMLGDGARYVLGIDPSMRFIVQHLALQRYAHNPRFDLLPLGIEDMPTDMPVFDTVFSMGVLYHRRRPIDHLLELAGLLQADGELVLETLIIDDADNGVLTPKDRYAKMRNVWSIMTIDKILELLAEAGFKDARCVDVSITSTDEQRSTDWMTFHSLKEFLDPIDQSKTVEGYPAPKRGTFIAHR
ncbi:tRNA 5-methoxyuridine(34)/uridine 5-oxyacetic acid(34) synthase CmoB [Arenicella xantha]|uniref:tRNA U34 carboxymethyltransferase n=1 Tax=Arenicella xantha TaxID=644221 RepID=A0A395JMX6_9GAMM|nr:tRNA 5-methoxyuridine(34)/uridine 5-oxyacetic acid(34) synthase CmoB [Arenicella xantha]RBP52643.1 tRNA (mo5U34)-methyltransferase [Arenicella xantha]